MSSQIQAIRGMHDLLPEQTPVWQSLEQTVTRVLRSYGYREIRFPVLEKTELFRRSIGEVTDIVEKEMYTFEDRNGDSLTLRPEGTAGCVRACVENGLLHNQVQRIWYTGPMFRHERPQKGRYRQFHQVGVEAFGMEGPDIDAELILMNRRIWQGLGLDGNVKLQINSLGTSEERRQFRGRLAEFLSGCADRLDADSRRRLQSNPLRVLDSKNPETQKLLENAPSLGEFLGEESQAHFSALLSLLDQAGVAYTVNPRLVRGLDYYGKTVYEWVTGDLGAQGTVCAGGRYDGLVEQLGGRPVPAVGFAMGLERLVELLTQGGFSVAGGIHAYLVVAGDTARSEALSLAELWRSRLPGLELIVHCGGGSMKSQFRRADRSGAALALVLGDDEVERRELGVKPLREDRKQSVVPMDQVAEHLAQQLGLALDQ